MELLVLSLFVINISSFFTTVSSVSSDCINLNTFLKLDTSINCCETNLAACDAENNKIVELEFIFSEDYRSYNINLAGYNFDNFPIFENLKNITFDGIFDFNNNILPPAFFNQPNLNYLRVTNCQIKNIPQNLNKNSMVKIIELYSNQISEFPYHLKDLKNLKELHLAQNDISGEIDLREFENLTKFDIHVNDISNIKNIPSTLTYLDIEKTRLTELPPSLFKLKNLKELYLENNPNLKAKIIGFENPVEQCGFKGTSIECYKPGSCEKIVEWGANDIADYVSGSETVFSECTEADIKEVKNKQVEEDSIIQNSSNNGNKSTDDNKNDTNNENNTLNKNNTNNNNNSSFKYIVIGGCGILVLMLLSVFVVKYHSSLKKNKNDSEFDNGDIIATNTVNNYNNNNNNNNNNNINENNKLDNNNIYEVNRNDIYEMNNILISNDVHVLPGKTSINNNSNALSGENNSDQPPSYDSIVNY